MTVPHPNNVTVSSDNTIIQVTDQMTTVSVEELKNVVTVDEESPNDVYVSVNGSPTRNRYTSILYSSGAPWTVEIDVEI
jgi:hypothetical protein